MAVPENDLHDHHHPPERSLTGFGEKCLLKRLLRWRLFTPVRGGPITTNYGGGGVYLKAIRGVDDVRVRVTLALLGDAFS